MIALNQYRLSRGETIAYDESAFCANASALRGNAPDPHGYT